MVWCWVQCTSDAREGLEVVGGVWVEYERIGGGWLFNSFLGELNEEFDIFCEFVLVFLVLGFASLMREAVAGWVQEHVAQETFWVTSWSHFCCWLIFVYRIEGGI